MYDNNNSIYSIDYIFIVIYFNPIAEIIYFIFSFVVAVFMHINILYVYLFFDRLIFILINSR